MQFKELTEVKICQDGDKQWLEGIPENESLGTIFYIEWTTNEEDQGFYEVCKDVAHGTWPLGLKALLNDGPMDRLLSKIVVNAIPIKWRYAEPWEIIYAI